MSRFRLREIQVDNYRCFEELKLSLEEDTTVLFAENGGGKDRAAHGPRYGPRRVPARGAENSEARSAARSHGSHTRREGATRAGRSVQARVDRCGGRIGFRPLVNGSSSRVRTNYEPEQSDSRSTRANSSARRSLAVVRVVRRRSFGADPRTESQGRANWGPLGSLRLRARPEPRRGPATSVAPGRDARGCGPEAAGSTGTLFR